MHKGAAALLWGGPVAALLANRRGGNPPAPAFLLGETGKGDRIPCCRRTLRDGICDRQQSHSLSGSGQPECARPTTVGNGSGPPVNAATPASLRSGLSAPEAAAPIPPPRWEPSRGF